MSESNRKIFLDVLNGRQTERVPFWFMRQAGRYLPEYRDLRQDKGGFLNMVYDPVAASEITIQPIRRFHMDAAILFSDILVVPHGLGQHLEFVAGEGPKLTPIQDGDALDQLDLSDFDRIIGPVYETVSRTRENLDAEGFTDVALIGFAGSPWTVATYMVEGGGSKDFMTVKTCAYRDPEFFQKLIDLLVEYTSRYLIGQAKAGAEALQLFDSWSGVLDEEQFNRWVIAPTARIVRNIRDVYPDIPIIGFPKGAGFHYPRYMQETGITAIGLDSQIAPSWAAEYLQCDMPVQGNLDPACLRAGGDALEHSVHNILDRLGKDPFIFNLGHGIHKDTPIAHVEWVANTVKTYRKS